MHKHVTGEKYFNNATGETKQLYNALKILRHKHGKKWQQVTNKSIKCNEALQEGKYWEQITKITIVFQVNIAAT